MISALLFPFTSDYLTLSLAAVVLGIGTSGAGQAPQAMAIDATANEPRGISMGLYRLFGDVGFLVGPIILGLIADNVSLKAPFFFTAAMLLVCTVLIQHYAVETYSAKKNNKLLVPA